MSADDCSGVVEGSRIFDFYTWLADSFLKLGELDLLSGFRHRVMQLNQDVLHHLRLCRPIGLLLLLFRWRHTVHFHSFPYVVRGLHLWKFCTAGWHGACQLLAGAAHLPTEQGAHILPQGWPELSGELKAQYLESARLNNITRNPEAWPPWRMAKRFLQTEAVLLRRLYSDLDVVPIAASFPPILPATDRHRPRFMDQLDSRGFGVYSQNKEDGILECILRSIGYASKTFVEIGTEDGTRCNTRFLRVAHGFRGYMFDMAYTDPRIGLSAVMVTLKDATVLLNETLSRGDSRRGVPAIRATDLDVLSIDTDGGDLGIWMNLCITRWKPRVVIIEVDPNPQSMETYSPIVTGHMWPPPALAPLPMVTHLAKTCGYKLVYHNHVNGFFVREELLRPARKGRGGFEGLQDVPERWLAWAAKARGHYNPASVAEEMQARHMLEEHAQQTG